MTRQIITVIGGTGAQGGGVVDALLASGQFAVRVVTRNPASKSAEALEKRGVQVVKGDLIEPSSLRAAFEGAYGAFLVTNFWEPAQIENEAGIAVAAVKEARDAGVQHFIWSTLPDAEKLTGGRLKLRPHLSQRYIATIDPASVRRPTSAPSGRPPRAARPRAPRRGRSRTRPRCAGRAGAAPSWRRCR